MCVCVFVAWWCVHLLQTALRNDYCIGFSSSLNVLKNRAVITSSKFPNIHFYGRLFFFIVLPQCRKVEQQVDLSIACRVKQNKKIKSIELIFNQPIHCTDFTASNSNMQQRVKKFLCTQAHKSVRIESFAGWIVFNNLLLVFFLCFENVSDSQQIPNYIENNRIHLMTYKRRMKLNTQNRKHAIYKFVFILYIVMFEYTRNTNGYKINH